MTAPENLNNGIRSLESSLGEDLRSELQATDVAVPAAADAAARAVIRSRAAEIRRAAGRRHRHLWPVWAAAAALLLAAGTWLALSRGKSPLAGDIDRSGRVDIVDAYLLARRINEGGKLEARWDITGDGKVNRGDVEAVATRAVSIEGR